MGCEIDALPLRVSVEKFGGIDQVREDHKWQMVREDLGIESTTSSGYQLNKAFKAYWEEDTDVEESEDDRYDEPSYIQPANHLLKRDKNIPTAKLRITPVPV